jgi:predicted nucleotidyltransferase
MDDQCLFIKNYDFFKKLIAQDFIKEVWLFGSRARGNHRERSDIDLAVRLTEDKPSYRDCISDLLEENTDTLLKIDVVYLNDLLEERFKQQIDQDKLILYRK